MVGLLTAVVRALSALVVHLVTVRIGSGCLVAEVSIASTIAAVTSLLAYVSCLSLLDLSISARLGRLLLLLIV